MTLIDDTEDSMTAGAEYHKATSSLLQQGEEIHWRYNVLVKEYMRFDLIINFLKSPFHYIS